MIEFPCHCGNQFSVPQEMSGGSIQCPQCGRLNDVPLLDDLTSMDSGGTYKLDDAPTLKDDPHRLAELTHVFTKAHYDHDGQPIDLRGPAQHAGGASPGPRPLEALLAGDSAHPKYDPTTGQLISEIDIKPEPTPPPAFVPNARLTYAPRNMIDGMDIPSTQDFFTIPALLFKPANLLVMLFIFLAHLVGQIGSVVISFGFFLAVPLWVPLHALLLAHFGNVVDETGPQNKMELPAPLRNMSWREDIWAPFCQVVVAGAVCFGPALVFLGSNASLPPRVILALGGALMLVGFVFFPATLLTATTSGSWPNIRPDRLIGVVRICGAQYWVSMAVGFVAVAVWVAGFLGISVVAITTMTAVRLPPFIRWYTTDFVLAVGVYLLHLFCWQLGMLYRKHHMDFPWILQRHGGRPIGAPTGFPVGKSKQRPPAAPPPAPLRVEPIDSRPPAG